MELALVGVFLRSHSDWERLKGVVNDDLLSPQTQDMLRDIEAYYAQTKHDKAGSDYLDWVKIHRKPKHTTDKWDQYTQAVREAWKQGSLKGEQIITALSLRADAQELAYMADQYAMGNPDIDLFGHEIYDFIEASKRRARVPTDHTCEVRPGTVGDVLDIKFAPGNELNWQSQTLQNSLGPLRIANLVVVAAYVETGKSRTVLGEAVHMAKQCTGDECVMFINNEEGGNDVWLRSRQAALGMTEAELVRNRDKADALFLKEMGGHPDRFILIDGAQITAGLIRAKLRQYNCRALFVDQLHKVKGLSKGGASVGDLDGLQRVYMFAREIAKEHCPVVAVHQAWGDASPEARTRHESPNYYLAMHELAGSRQVIQAEADAIVLIGINPNEREYRYLSVVKNKMKAGPQQYVKAKLLHDLGRCMLESTQFNEWEN